MKIARMEALLLSVPLGDRQFFYDDGFVDDVEKYAAELDRRYGVQDGIKIVDAMGCCSVFYNHTIVERPVKADLPFTEKRYVHIFYEDKGDETTNLYTRGHEETHALHSLGRLNYLFVDVLKAGFVPPVIKALGHRYEEVADFGAAWGLIKRGIAKPVPEKRI